MAGYYTTSKPQARLGGRLHVLYYGVWQCVQVVQMERTVATGAERVQIERPNGIREWYPLDACMTCSCLPTVSVMKKNVRTP